MKKFISFLLILSMSVSLLTLSVFSASAADSEASDIYYDLSYDKSYYIVDGCSYSAIDIVIQSQIDGVAVTEIGSSAFSYHSSLTSVTILVSITSIEQYAFSNCRGLTTVTIPASVTSIGTWVFDGCDNLKTINCEAKSMPSGWDEDWLGDCAAKVKWGVALESSNKNNLGDVDDNGTVDMFDYLLVKRDYFDTYTLTEDEEARADVDGSGEIDQFDYVLIKRIYFGTYTIGSISPHTHDWEAANCTKPKNCRICGITEGKPETDTHIIDEATMGCKYCDYKLNQADYKYLAASDFRSVKNKYSTATPLLAYVTLYVNKNSEICVLTDVWYKIIDNYNVVTLHNLSTGQTIESPYEAYMATADRYYGATKLHLMDLAGEVLSHQSKEQTNGTYVSADELY